MCFHLSSKHWTVNGNNASPGCKSPLKEEKERKKEEEEEEAFYKVSPF